jgi:hypothetical protein
MFETYIICIYKRYQQKFCIGIYQPLTKFSRVLTHVWWWFSQRIKGWFDGLTKRPYDTGWWLNGRIFCVCVLSELWSVTRHAIAILKSCIILFLRLRCRPLWKDEYAIELFEGEQLTLLFDSIMVLWYDRTTDWQ